MNLVDSSAWLEYFANGPNAAFFAKAIERVDQLVVPTLSLFAEYASGKPILRGWKPGRTMAGLCARSAGWWERIVRR